MVEPACVAASVVLVGAWNEAIFSPPFVAREVFGGAKKLEVSLALDADGATVVAFRDMDAGLRLSVKRSNVIVEPTEGFDLRSAERVAIQVLELLPRTPVRAVGMNYQYHSAEEPSRPPLDDAGLGTHDFALSSGSIVRRLVSGQDVINLSLLFGEDGVRIEFNHHGDVTTAKMAAAWAKDRAVVTATRTEAMLKTLSQGIWGERA